MRISKLFCLTAGLALSMSSAMASVQFQWTGVSNGLIGVGYVPPSSVTQFIASNLQLTIEVTDEAAQSGHISYHSPQNCGVGSPTPVCPLVDSPILFFHASYTDAQTSMSLTFFPASMTSWEMWNLLNIDLNLSSAGLVSGSIEARYHDESDVRFVGENGLFTAAFNSDNGDCFMHCTGAQGIIAESNSVPEPSTAALLGLAVLGLVVRKYVPALTAPV